VFPSEAGLERYRRVAWDAYVTFCSAYDDVFDVLQQQYADAVAQIPRREAERPGLGHPDQHLAEHLMILYRRGKAGLDAPMFRAFWEAADDELRAHAIGWEGQCLEQTEEDVLETILERLRALWERRLAVAARQREKHRSEMVAFGWWFAAGKFDPAWAVARLSDTLSLSGWVEPDDMVVKRLAAVAADLPRDAVHCLRLIVEGDEEGWHVSSWQDHARVILRTALDSQDPVAHDAAEDLVNRLLARGYFGFRDLLE
jgi:hypothetical protein